MHQAAIPHGRQQNGKSKVETEDARTQAAICHRNRVTWPEGDVVKDSAILPECNLAFGAAIKVVEHSLRQALAGDGTEVLDAHNPWRRHCTRQSVHVQFQYRKR